MVTVTPSRATDKNSEMRMKGLEPSLREKLEPKSSASTNSATSACVACL